MRAALIRVLSGAMVVALVLVAAGCGPGSVADDDLVVLAADPDAALAALVDPDTAGPLLTGRGDDELTEAVILAAFDDARTDPDATIRDYAEVINVTAELLDGRSRLNPGAARGLAQATAWHMVPLAVHFTPGGRVSIPATSLGPVLTAIAGEPPAAERLAHALGVLHIVNFSRVAEILQMRDDLIDISGADQSGWLSGIFEMSLGTAAGGSTDDIDWSVVVAGADATVDVAVADPDAFLDLTMAAVLDAIDANPPLDNSEDDRIVWDRAIYADATATATFVALEQFFANAETDVTIDDATRQAYQAPGRIHASLTDPDFPSAPAIEPVTDPARVLQTGWRSFCMGPCLDD